MFILRIQVLLGSLAVACVMANPDFEMKFKFSGNLLSIPATNINHHIDRLHELGGKILSPLLGFGKSNNDVAPVSTDTRNTLKESSGSSLNKETTDKHVLYNPTRTTLVVNFPEATTETDITNKTDTTTETDTTSETDMSTETVTTTETDTTTDLLTTTEDYDDDIAIRLAASPQAIASLLG